MHTTNKSSFKLTAQDFKQETDLILGKGVYPYEYIDNQERFKETVLPPKEAFCSKLSDGTISQKDYNHAQQVWKSFNCKKLGDNHDLYLKTDVVLLADIFQTFEKHAWMHTNLTPYTITLHLALDCIDS